ncbi:(Fe-S)-binding protein [Chloroflexota bacterium]
MNLRIGQPSGPFRDWGERIKGLIIYVGGQRRLFRVLLPGTAHFFIFWGFIFLSLTILQAIAEGLMTFSTPNFVLPFVGQFGLLALLQDIFALVVIFAIAYALYIRLIVNPERYKGSHKSQGVIVLIFILIIMLSLYIMNGIRINLGKDSLEVWRPISRAIGLIFAGFNSNIQFIIEEVAYWIHLGVVLLFLTELPIGKHFHVVTSIPAVLLRNLEPRGKMPAAPEFGEEIGISSKEQFRWRQMLDFYTCTECGRCQDVCPAYTSGLPLSPKMLMIDLRDHLKDNGTVPGKQLSPTTTEEKKLVGDVISDQVLWACSTCYACDEECPLFIEHVTPIVDMRRHLVIEGRVDSELQGTLENLGRYGNSFGQSERMRAKWTQSIQPKIKDARREPIEYLWFVGDYASYSPALKDITIKTAEVFQSAGLNFGILYDAERNSGGDVRRTGEEGLYEMLSEKNIASIEKCNFQTIVTTDPHTYNTLKNEYSFSKNYPILHYSELIEHLIQSGKIILTQKLGKKVTYHDPCYLGRYNNIFDPPRNVIRALGCELIEMPRNADNALCCGAGGGRIWMSEDDIKERPSEIRIREAAELFGVTDFVVTCPKDITMFRDAIKTTGNDERMVVKDLIELVHEAAHIG